MQQMTFSQYIYNLLDNKNVIENIDNKNRKTTLIKYNITNINSFNTKNIQRGIIQKYALII